MIKHLLLPLLLLLTAAFTSCTKEDNNGDLGGNWQLLCWQSLPDGATAATNADGIYYTIHRSTLRLRRLDLADTYLASFAVRGDSLVLDRVFLSPFDEPATPADLAPFGFAATGRMRIVSLSSDRLVLQSDAARLMFRKY